MTQDPPEEEPPGRLRPTRRGVLAGWGVAGLVGGWSLRRVAEIMGDTAPIVTWVQALVLVLGAVILGYVALATRRTARADRPVRPPAAHEMVNRLVLARACALVGALVAGGYAGYALSWIGDPAQLAGQRILRSTIAAAAGAAIVATSLLLERACRVPPDEDGS